MAANLAPKQVGDDLLMRWPQAEGALVAVGKAQQFGAVLLPAPRFLPQLGGLDHRHQQLQGAAAVHLLAHDLLDPPQYLEAQRQPGVEPRGQLADHAGAQHELMADGFGAAGNFAGGGQMKG